MASQAVTDFLTKEIKASNNIVTFRLLSRQLSIHVTKAKRELELFYEASKRTKDPAFATYVLTGAPALELDTRGGSTEQPSRHLVLLAGEDELEDAKGRFASPPSQHVYSLSPVPLKDHGLLTSVADRVRQLDKQNGQQHASQLGLLLSEDAPWSPTMDTKSKRTIVEAPQDSAPPKKDTAPPKKDTPAPKVEQAAKPKAASDNTQSALAKGFSRQNTLNFGGSSKKASGEGISKNLPADKPLAEKKQPIVVKKEEQEQSIRSKTATPQPTSKPPSTASSKASHAEPSKPVVASKATTGRSKRVLDSSDEDEPAPQRSRPAIKRKKSRASEDDEDESMPAAEKSSASLAAMMDIDDDAVVNGRSTREATPEHVPSNRETAAAAKAAKAEASKGVDQKQKASRKRVPKGKKRVMKTRRVKNAKGYMVTEDYSSYEDADPNGTDKADDTDVQSETDYGDDIDVDVSGKVIQPKAKCKPAPSASKPQTKRPPSDGSKLKKSKSSDAPKAGQQKLASFFGKK